jgi:hypothetical protein
MKIEAENYEVVFGSNLISECGRVIEIVGKGINKQIIRFREGEDGKILFNCTVKDQKGKTVAKVANSIIQYVRKGYEAKITGDGIKVVNESTGDIWLEFSYVSPRKFKLNGIFFLPGYKIIATDDYLEINKNRISNCTFKSCSAAIGLG